MADDAPVKTGDSVSNTRLYLGNLPKKATKADVETHFQTHGTGKIVEVKLMSGFGFVEYEDAEDARDVVPVFHGSEFMGERLIVQFARGNTRPKEDHGGYHQPRVPPRPRRTVHRMTITSLPEGTSWQDLKDFARQADNDVVFSEVTRDRDQNGHPKGYVEYETEAALNGAVEKLNGVEFKGSVVHCVADPQAEIPRQRERFRSRSPGGYRDRMPYPGPPRGYYDYDRRGPPRGYTPPSHRDDYRRRTPPPPPPRGYYDDPRDDRYGPPRGRPPMDDYPPPRYDYRGPPRGYGEDPYMNGHGHGREPYGRPRSPPRDGRYYERDGYGRPNCKFSPLLSPSNIIVSQSS